MVLLTSSRIETFEYHICETRLHKVKQVNILSNCGLRVGLDNTDVVDSSACNLRNSSVHQGFQ
jgi:hypothetical protein